jgi:hypothetical protein
VNSSLYSCPDCDTSGVMSVYGDSVECHSCGDCSLVLVRYHDQGLILEFVDEELSQMLCERGDRI